MFKFTKKDKRSNLEREIDSVINSMSKLSPSSEEYSEMTSNLEKLYKAKAGERSSKLSADTVAVVVGNLFGIVLILGYEKAGTITSKALNYVLKGRV